MRPPAAEEAGRDRAGEERWGRFEGQVLAAWHDDGRTMTLLEPFGYVDPSGIRWPAPEGSEVNGASIPRAFWSVMSWQMLTMPTGRPLSSLRASETISTGKGKPLLRTLRVSRFQVRIDSRSVGCSFPRRCGGPKSEACLPSSSSRV